MSPQTDHSAFVDRLQDCIASVGSVTALAKRADMIPNTIRRYLSGSEPTRPVLVAIATAANVTPEWLAFGGSNPKAAKTNACTDESEVLFTSRLKALVARYGGPENFAKEKNLQPQVLDELLTGKPISVGHLAQLAADWSIPIRWLLSNEPGYHGDRALGHITTTRQFLRRLDEIDDKRLYSGELQLVSGYASDPSWRGPVLRLMERIYECLPPGNFDIHELSTTLGNYAAIGDLAVVDLDAKKPETGYYLFQDGTASKSNRFIRRVSRVGGVLRDISLVGPQEITPFAEGLYLCVGRVVLLVRRFSS